MEDLRSAIEDVAHKETMARVRKEFDARWRVLMSPNAAPNEIIYDKLATALRQYVHPPDKNEKFPVFPHATMLGLAPAIRATYHFDYDSPTILIFIAAALVALPQLDVIYLDYTSRVESMSFLEQRYNIAMQNIKKALTTARSTPLEMCEIEGAEGPYIRVKHEMGTTSFQLKCVTTYPVRGVVCDFLILDALEDATAVDMNELVLSLLSVPRRQMVCISRGATFPECVRGTPLEIMFELVPKRIDVPDETIKQQIA